MSKVHVDIKFRLTFDQHNGEAQQKFLEEMKQDYESYVEGATIEDTEITDWKPINETVQEVTLHVTLDLDSGVELSEVIQELDFTFTKKDEGTIKLTNTSLFDYDVTDSR